MKTPQIHFEINWPLSRRHGLILYATFSRFWAQFALEDFCCPVPKLNRLFMVGSCFTGHAIQLFWHMSTCYQIILRIFFHKISQNILVIQEFQIILVCSSYLWPWMTIWKCAFFLFLLPNHACIFCSFRWIDHWLKTTYETLNVSWSFFLWFFFQKEKSPRTFSNSGHNKKHQLTFGV